MPQCHVYIHECCDGSYYVGMTEDLRLRLVEHEAGEGSDWTARRRPVELVWSEAFPDRDTAAGFERQLKGWRRAKKEALVRGDLEALPHLSQGTEPDSEARRGPR